VDPKLGYNKMHESFSTSSSRPSDHCGFKTDAQSLPSLLDSPDLLETVYSGGKVCARAKGDGEMLCHEKILENFFILLNN